MKQNRTILKELRRELCYWQGMYRLERRGLQRTADKIKTIAAEMRKIQKNIHIRRTPYDCDR